ncbi:transposase [bacterium]|nr:transposase [bacterium]
METTNNRRRKFSNADKLKLLKSHLHDGVSIDELCRRHSIHPTLLYRWKREFLSSLDSSNEHLPSPARTIVLRQRIKAIDARIERLKDDLASLREQLEVLSNGISVEDVAGDHEENAPLS